MAGIGKTGYQPVNISDRATNATTTTTTSSTTVLTDTSQAFQGNIAKLPECVSFKDGKIPVLSINFATLPGIKKPTSKEEVIYLLGRPDQLVVKAVSFHEKITSISPTVTTQSSTKATNVPFQEPAPYSSQEKSPTVTTQSSPKALSQELASYLSPAQEAHNDFSAAFKSSKTSVPSALGELKILQLGIDELNELKPVVSSKIFENMDIQDAARVMENMKPEKVAAIVKYAVLENNIKPERLAAIMSEISSEKIMDIMNAMSTVSPQSQEDKMRIEIIYKVLCVLAGRSGSEELLSPNSEEEAAFVMNVIRPEKALEAV